MTTRRSDDLDDVGASARTAPSAPVRWLFANWFSLIILLGMVLNMGGWVRFQERADSEQLQLINQIQEQLSEFRRLADLIYVRKDVLAREHQTIQESITHLSQLLERDRAEEKEFHRRLR